MSLKRWPHGGVGADGLDWAGPFPRMEWVPALTQARRSHRVNHAHSFVTFSLLLLFGRSVVSSYLRPHGLQPARLPCPSPSPRICSDSCPLCWWCHPTSAAPFSCPPSFAASGSFLRIRWSKYYLVWLSWLGPVLCSMAAIKNREGGSGYICKLVNVK